MFTKFRVALAAVLTALAVIGGGSAWVASAAAIPAAIPKCGAADLGAWVSIDRGNGAAGTIFYPLEFTNVSNHSCSLQGFPGVSAINSAGHQLGDSAIWNHTSTPHRVVLAPGATAHAILGWSDAAVFTSGCKPVTAFELKIFPPDQRSATHAVFDLQACSTTGHTYLQVQPILPGV